MGPATIRRERNRSSGPAPGSTSPAAVSIASRAALPVVSDAAATSMHIRQPPASPPTSRNPIASVNRPRSPNRPRNVVSSSRRVAAASTVQRPGAGRPVIGSSRAGAEVVVVMHHSLAGPACTVVTLGR